MGPFRPTLSATVRLLTLSCCLSSIRAASRSDYIGDATNATDVLNQRWYDASTGRWQNLWWDSANALTSLAGLAAVDSQFASTASDYFQNILVAAPASNGGSFLNDYYDDEGWWAMAWIRAYDVTGNSTYLDTAKTIFQDLTTGLNATCGGQWWSKDKQYIASIANELFLSVAASLANRAGNDGTDYRTYAQDQADWLLNKSGVINSNNTIVDGIDISNCQAQGTVWTYNQGAILGGLVEMHTLTGNSNYLNTANSIANGALLHLTDKGILTEPGYPGPPDTTGSQFKGIFARNLAILQAASPNDLYVTFLRNNADSIMGQDRQDDGQIGPDWQGPYFDASAASQSSALDCLVAAAAVSS